MPTLSTSTLSLTASAANLNRLVIIRLILMIGLLLALAYAYQQAPSGIVHPAHISTLVALALLNMATYWRLQQAWPVTDAEYFCQLLIDISGLTVLLYFSGGATNPFVSYYLVPLTISAAILPWRFTWIIAGLSLSAYSLMLFFYQPLPDFHPTMDHSQHDKPGFNLHIIGMWFTFALSSGLITYFVVKMANALRQQESAQVSNREDELLDEQILAVATLAAGTAHELGTPLATMAVLLDEMEQDQQNSSLLSDLQLLKNQVARCKHILQGLVSTAQTHSHGQKTAVPVADYLRQIVSHWQVLRPQASYQLTINENCQHSIFHIDPTLEQAINNLLNNAADACEQNIEINADCDQQFTLISIRDHGPGIPLDIAEQIGKPFVTSKGKGLGLGLFLTHATINRYGGEVKLYNHPQGGTLAELHLPADRQEARDRQETGTTPLNPIKPNNSETTNA
jgi:two-component system sensor histidine kinase RegB